MKKEKEVLKKKDKKNENSAKFCKLWDTGQYLMAYYH